MSAFVVSNIATDLKMLSNDQRFIFGNNTLPEPLAAFKIDNIFAPTVGTPSVTNFETRNNTLSGFRWVHTTNSGDTFGFLKLQSFINAQSTGNDILLFNSDGSVVINNLNASNLDVNSPLHINYNSPFTALYLKGPSFTEAGFVYNNNLLETLLFSATDLRISSTSGQIHFGLDSGTNDFITFNNQGFKSIVNFIANNPDTSGFIPEKGLILETSGTPRGAVTFDYVDNQMKIYTNGNDPILFSVNSINAMKILTSGNIDLLNHRITNAANPVNSQDYTTKYYVDNLPANLPSLVNVTGSTQTFQFNSAASKFIVANTTSNSVNEYQVNFGGSIGGLRMGVSGDSPSNQFSYINTSGGSPIYLQSDGVTKMYMNGLGSFVVGTSPVGFPYAKFDVHGGELNVINEESVIRATSSTNSAKIEINNSSVSGRLYELRSNSDGSFGIFDRTSNALRLGIDSSGNITGNFPSSSSFTTPQSLPYPVLTFNWSYDSVTNPSPYEFVNNFTDSQISKNFKYRIATTDIATREWNHDYTLIGNSDLNGIYNLNYKVLSLTYTPLSITIYPFASSQNLMNISVPINMGGFEIKNALNPTTPQSLSTKNYVDTRPITLTGAVTGINNIANPIFTTFASTIPVSGANQIFNFSLNSNVVYRLNNTLAATTGTPSTIALSLNNATNGGYRFLHTSTSTDPAGLGTLKLQVLNSSGVTADVFTASVNPGNGITDTLFNSTATFNNVVTIQNNQSLIVTGNSSIADYLVMNNTNPIAKTQLRINNSGLPVAAFGYDSALSQVYIDSPFGAGSPFLIKFGGTTRFSMDNLTGNINLFSSRITNAANPVNPQDYATKAYVDSTSGGSSVTLTGAVTGSGSGTINTTLTPTVNVNSASYAFNLNNSNFSGITEFQISHGIPYLKFGVNTAGSGNYIDSIFDPFIIKMGGADKFIFSSVGNLGIGGSGPTQAKLVVNGGVQNVINQDSCIRVISSLDKTKIEIENTTPSTGNIWTLDSISIGSFGIYNQSLPGYGLLFDSSNNVTFGNKAYFSGFVGILSPSTTPNSPLQFGNTSRQRTITLFEGANNSFQYTGFGTSSGSLLTYLNSTSVSNIWYAGTSSTTSNEIARITGTGDLIVASTIYGRRVSGLMTMQGNAVGTTVTTALVYYKVAGTTTSNSLNGVSSPVSNRFTHTASNSVVALINVSFTATHNGAGGDDMYFALYKNGLQLSNTVISTEQANNSPKSHCISTLINMATNDYIELWCSHSVNNKIVTVPNLMFTYTTT